MRKVKWRGLLGVAVCMTVFLLLGGCGKTEERKSLGEIYAVEAGDLFEVYLDGIAKGTIYFDTCEGNESEIRKTKKYGTELLTMQLGEEIPDKGEGEEKLFDAVLSYAQDGEEKDSMSLHISQYEDYIAVVQEEDGKEECKYYQTNIDVQEAFNRLSEMIYATKHDGLGLEKENNLDVLMRKPVIYLYPEREMNIQVRLDSIDLTCTYPAYQDGWNVIAKPDGTIFDADSLREYYCLYYEGNAELPEERECGFIVKREDYQAFLEEKLAILGLRDKEAQEFIVYWLPVMQEYDRLFVHFVEQEVLERCVPLKVTPQPDSVIRIFMQLSEVEEGKRVEKQQLTKVERKGYSVVEWGGSFLEE